ncbi:hypothetical protein JTE90_013464 [Oedothorax gibbosus]|uniref:Endonuclease/exonuclease/phosphatase domain-containing protein n=1 Tax=Oedothorax gibbosus TaxID=931172 RepID=A0AAV6VKK5_9ARAC|nr:hypothetical protein JTE90_013464 [Oedothorax gibbosus]
MSLYNPPNNRPNFDCLLGGWVKDEMDNLFLYGDFNAYRRWGYDSTDPVGSIVENVIDLSPVEFVENRDGSPTFLSYRGATSHPGGAGHKLLVAELNSGEYREPLSLVRT